MTNLKLGLGLTLITALIFVVGCQPEPNRNNRRFGRNAFGNQAQRPINTSGDYITNQRGDLEMSRVAALFAAPGLSSVPDQALGQVSARTGVRLWSEVYVDGDGQGNGTINKGRSRIHIEITDSNATQYGAFFVHVGYDQDGYEAAEGGVSGNSVAVRFDQAGYGSIMLTGQISGSTITGELTFINTMTNHVQESLGTFSMQTCAFFVCQ